MGRKVTKDQREIIEFELRRGTNKSRIATLLDLKYDEAVELIHSVKESIRPEIGSRVAFIFREVELIGDIVALLTNSAVVEIDWDESDRTMKNICATRTVVNFKDIDRFIQEESSDSE